MKKLNPHDRNSTVGKIKSVVYTVEYQIALNQWQSSMEKFTALNVVIDSYIVQLDYTPFQSADKKNQLLNLKECMIEVLLKLMETMGSDLEPMKVEQLLSHHQIVDQKCTVLSNKLRQLGYRINYDE